MAEHTQQAVPTSTPLSTTGEVAIFPSALELLTSAGVARRQPRRRVHRVVRTTLMRFWW